MVVYGFGTEPMFLLSNLKINEKKKLCHIITKVYLLRWRIEEYFRFKKQQFELEDLRVMSLQSIRNLNLFATLAVGYIILTSVTHKGSIFLSKLQKCSKRIYKIPKFIFYAIGYFLERVLSYMSFWHQQFYSTKSSSLHMIFFHYFKLALFPT